MPAYHNRGDFQPFVAISAIAAISALFVVISSAQVRFDPTKPAAQVAKEGAMTSAAIRLPIEGELPSLANATAWLNSQPLTAAGVRGSTLMTMTPRLPFLAPQRSTHQPYGGIDRTHKPKEIQNYSRRRTP